MAVVALTGKSSVWPRPMPAASRWRKWGPYVSERQWGTVREDYSADGDAWSYLPHDHARSRAYRWGEDGIGGFCDAKQHALHGRRAVERPGPDPEGAHVRAEQPRGQSRRGRQGTLLLSRRGADLQLRPHALQVSAGGLSLRPAWCRRTRRRDRRQPEFEIIDTGMFDDDRYFDVDIEYAKAGADDILLRPHGQQSRARGGGDPRAAPGLVPQQLELVHERPQAVARARRRPRRARARDARRLRGPFRRRPDEIRFCENETNARQLFGRSEEQPERAVAYTRTACTTTSCGGSTGRRFERTAPRWRRSSGGPCARAAPALPSASG